MRVVQKHQSANAAQALVFLMGEFWASLSLSLLLMVVVVIFLSYYSYSLNIDDNLCPQGSVLEVVGTGHGQHGQCSHRCRRGVHRSRHEVHHRDHHGHCSGRLWVRRRNRHGLCRHKGRAVAHGQTMVGHLRDLGAFFRGTFRLLFDRQLSVFHLNAYMHPPHRDHLQTRRMQILADSWQPNSCARVHILRMHPRYRPSTRPRTSFRHIPYTQSSSSLGSTSVDLHEWT